MCYFMKILFCFPNGANGASGFGQAAASKIFMYAFGISNGVFIATRVSGVLENVILFL